MPPIFAPKVKQVLISANDSLNYDNPTYDNIFNTVKKFDASMNNNKKLLMYQLQIKKKANFCKQNGLPPIRQKGKKITMLRVVVLLFSCVYMVRNLRILKITFFLWLMFL